MTIQADRERLSQPTPLCELLGDHDLTELVTVYLSDYGGGHCYDIYCALVPHAQVDRILSNPFWDFPHRYGMPGAVKHHDGKVEYLRYGAQDGVEPLVIARDFFEIRDNYAEICEEFRLFHGLYHDRKTDQYIKIDADGEEHLVAVVKPNRVEIRLKEIRQFLAVKDMTLIVQFEFQEYSKYSLDKLGLTKGESRKRDNHTHWEQRYGDFNPPVDHHAFSRVVGKRLVDPLPKSKSGFWGFAEEPKKKHLEFIISVDKNGDEITYTSNPDALANSFGANPEAPHYLTPVHFRKKVLDKYYQQPSKYSVRDSILWCGTLWNMSLDNDHDSKVCAWLGDLGRDLPYGEQLHWLADNIPPEGTVSNTYYQQQILAKATDSDRPDHLFKKSYHSLQKVCEEFLGWQLLLPLTPDDEHHFQRLRIPSADEQSDFDDLVLSLTKILIDSLNEKHLNKLIPVEKQSGLDGSIARLEVALASCGVEGASDHVSFLRKLQSLRSTGTAHRKGHKYQKVATDFGVESTSLRTVFAGILGHALAFLEYLIGVVRSGQLSTL